ncbi:MAG: helix-turn-helix transcriptional regulator [Rhodothermales bacterium]|nr:helix-turn-helix transcriptional regulator [Rhodothermales bacterium]
MILNATDAMGESFGKYLRRKRKKKNMSQRALASEAEVNFTYLSKVENDVPGFSTVSESTLKKMADALDVDADEMITRAGKVPSDVKQMLVDDFSLIKKLRNRTGQSDQTGSKQANDESAGDQHE